MILTDEQRALVDGARERAIGATKKPWRSCWDDVTIAPLHEHAAVVSDAKGLPCEGMVVGLLWYDGLNVACRKEDARFIAHARQGIPALCDLVDELEGQLKAERALWQELLILERNASDPASTELQARMLRERIGDVRSQLEATMAGARTYAATGLVKKSSAKDP